jgi:anaerobic selenocysteine-containing dehydrogenase
VTVEDSMSMVHASKGFLDPASPHLRSEPAIVAGIAKATVGEAHVDWDAMVGDYNLIRDKIEAVFPIFEDFNRRIQDPGGFLLPNPAASRVWNTPSGKAQFLPFPGLEEDVVLDDPDVLKLTTVRSHDQYNTTIYGLDDRYRGIFGRRDILFMNAKRHQTLRLCRRGSRRSGQRHGRRPRRLRAHHCGLRSAQGVLRVVLSRNPAADRA